MTSYPVRDAKAVPATLNDLSVPSPTLSLSSIDDSVFEPPVDSDTVHAVGNGHVISTAPNFRLPTRVTVDSESLAAASSGKISDHYHHHQQQQQQPWQKHEGPQNVQLPKCSKTATSTQVTPVTSDNGHHGSQHHHQRQQQQYDGQQNLSLPNCSRTVSSIEKIRMTGDNLHHPIYHHHQQQQHQQQQTERLQDLSLNSVNCSNTISSVEKIRMTNDQFLLPLENRHRRHHHHQHHQKQQQQQQQERQQKATSKNSNSSTAMTLTDFVQLAGDTVRQSRGHVTRRPPPPPPTGTALHTPPPTRTLHRTPTAVDGPPPVLGTEGKMSVSMTQPGRTVQDSFVISTLPRTKFQATRATNGEVCHRQPIPTLAARQATAAAQTPSVNGRLDWLSGHHSAAPTSKSKDATFIRDRVQFFTRNELAAAVATNKSSDSGKATSSSKTSWFRRALFR